MIRLNLGSAGMRFPGVYGFDRMLINDPDGHRVDCVCNLEDDWPIKDNSVDELLARHCFKHLSNPTHTMKELYRVLKPGGTVALVVPSTNGMGAFQDPDHKSFWNLNSFIYYDVEKRDGKVYGTNLFEITELYEKSIRSFQISDPYVYAQMRKP